MSRLTIYLDEETERQLRAAAKSQGLSASRWVACLIREKTENTWPQAVLDLAGAWPDFPTAEELRAGQPNDSVRQS
ncbi:MAG: CopG family transcriptional regulator [Bryobacteraceae bacterium]